MSRGSGHKTQIGRVVFLSSLHPDDPGEEFFEPELRVLATLVPILRVPIRPKASRQGPDLVSQRLLGGMVLRGACSVLARHPLASLRALAPLFDWRRPFKTARQLACAPKALWTASLLRSGDVLIAGWLTTPAAVALVASRIANVPWTAYAHRRDILEAASIARKVDDARFVRVISESSRQSLQERLGRPCRTQLIHLGVDVPSRLASLPREGGRRVLAIGHLIPLKNHETLIRALADPVSAEVHLTIAGSGPLAEDLSALAEHIGVADRLHLAGHIAHEDLMQRMLEGEWCLVTLASTTEGIPVSLIEALAAGIPVVASDVGGVAELVTPAGGLLVSDPLDSSAFASSWSELVQDWTEDEAAAARRWVSQEFDAAHTATELLTALAALVPE